MSQVVGGGGYLAKTRARFLEGTKFVTPEDCVNAGVKSVRDWCDILREERQMARIPDRPAGGGDLAQAGDFL